MKHQIIIRAKSTVGESETFFAFSVSSTGQLDYSGIITKSDFLQSDCRQMLDSSTYFTPSYYIYLESSLENTINIFIAPDVNIENADIFSYLTHIGALLAAVEAKDSLLAGELYLRRKDIFEKFALLTRFIVEPLCVEILFSLCFGRMQEIDTAQIPLIFHPAKKKLDFNPQCETLKQALIRWLRKNNTTFTLQVVGTNFYHWEAAPAFLNKLTNHLNCDDLTGYAAKIKKAKHDLYTKLDVCVQAEPYNPADEHAILVSIEDIEAKFTGCGGKTKAGYIRRFAAEIIRNAKEAEFTFKAGLARLSQKDIVVKVSM